MTYKKIRGLPKDSALFKVCDQSCTPLKHAKSNCYSHTSKPLSCFVIFLQRREGNNLNLHLLFFGGAPVTKRSHYAHVSFREWVSFPRMLWMYGGASYRGVDGSQPSDHQKITFQYEWWVIQDAEELGVPRCTILILVRTDCRFFFFSSIPSLFLSPVGTFLVQRKLLHKKTFFSNSFLPLSHPPIFLSCYLMEARGAFQILAQIISLFKLFSICLSNSEWNSMPHSAWLQAITLSSSVTM